MATDTKTFNAANEDTSSTVSATSQYDAAGNAIVTPMPGSETIGLTCTYNAWNRLVSASDGTTTVTYQYDGTGRRTERTQGGTTEHDYYSGQQVIQVYNYNGPVSPANFQGGQQYIWSPLYIDTPILRDTYNSSGDRVPGEQLYYTADADHNVTAVVQNNTIDGAWEAAERYSYNAYGDVTVYNKSWSPITGNQSQPGIGNTRLFAGMDADPLTGAYYDNARWYDPTNGTFFGRDPIGTAGGINLYEYCNDDPLVRSDPTGKGWWNKGNCLAAMAVDYDKCLKRAKKNLDSGLEAASHMCPKLAEETNKHLHEDILSRLCGVRNSIYCYELMLHGSVLHSQPHDSWRLGYSGVRGSLCKNNMTQLVRQSCMAVAGAHGKLSADRRLASLGFSQSFGFSCSFRRAFYCGHFGKDRRCLPGLGGCAG